MSGEAPTPPASSTVLDQAVEGLSDVADYLRLDPIPPLWRELRAYNTTKLRADLVAGLMVSIVTIPQALAFALIVGLPVGAVLSAAVIASFVFSLWGTSRHLVFGPTNTLAIILASALAATAAIPLNAIQKVVMIGFMMGLVQLVSGFFKIGSLSHFISRTVVIAYSTGAGILIAASQLGNFLGIKRAPDISLPGTFRHIYTQLTAFQFNAYAVGLGVASILAMILLRRWKPRWPEGLIVLGSAGLLSLLYDLVHTHISLPAELSFQGLGIRVVSDVGEVASSLPLFQGFPATEAFTFVAQVASIALAAAMLGMLETVSIAQTLAARSGQKVNPNQDLMAAGFANLVCSAYGSMAASASFLRSAVVFESKGATQLGPIFSAFFIVLLISLSSGLINYIPVTILAAFVILIAYRMAFPAEGKIVRTATRSDALVYWVTLLATLLLKLDVAIYIGMGLSLLLFLKKAASPSLVEYSFNDQGQLARLDETNIRDDAAISIVHVEGDLFFGAADLFQEQIRYLADDQKLKVVILRMKNARHLDATSVLSLLQLHDYLRASGRHILISGMGAEFAQVLERSGAAERLGRDNLFMAEQNQTMSTKKALKRATVLCKLTDGKLPALRVAYDKKRAAELERSAAMKDQTNPDFQDYQI